MRFTVISTNAAEGDFVASRILPATSRIVRGADRVYRFYQSDVDRDFGFTDHTGESLVDVHTFATLAEAQAWVNEDARQRQALLSASGRAQ